MENTLVLENAFARLEFTAEHLGLCAMIDKIGGINHLPTPPPKCTLWELLFRRGTQEQKTTNAELKYTDCQAERLADGTQRVVMKWEKVEYFREKQALTVVATVELPPDSGIARWRISVDYRSDFWTLWEVRYPCFAGLLAPGQYDVAYASNNWGFLFAKVDKPITPDCIYPSYDWAMPLVSISRGRNGIYVGAHDPEAWAKTFFVNPGHRLYVMTYPENLDRLGSNYPGHYWVHLGVHQGHWLQACKIYRRWALQQQWTSRGPLSGRQDVPKALKECALWFRSSTDFAPNLSEKNSTGERNAPMLDAQKYYGVPVGLHWYNWHHNTFDKHYPYFFPARPGFEERARDLVAHGILVMPYINVNIADYDHPQFKAELWHAAMKDPLGAPFPLDTGPGTGRLMEMCPHTETWQDVIAGLVERLTGECGVNAVYLDLLTALPPRLCFDPSHGHPLGGGGWFYQGQQQLCRKVKEIAEGRDIAFTSESIAEAYMNEVPAYLTWAAPIDYEIPMMPLVYSGYALYISSPIRLDVSDQSFIAAQGRAFLWGCQNGWMDVTMHREPKHRVKAEYLRLIGRYRTACHKFLTYGELLEPIEPTGPVETLELDWPTLVNAKRKAHVPCVFGALWKAEDGNLGVFLVNCLDRRYEVKYSVHAADHGLVPAPGKQCRIEQVTPDSRKMVGTHAAGVIERTETLEPYEIRVLEISVA